MSEVSDKTLQRVAEELLKRDFFRHVGVLDRRRQEKEVVLYRYDSSLRGRALLDFVYEEPTFVQLSSSLDEDNLDGDPVPWSTTEARAAYAAGVCVSGGKIGWLIDHPWFAVMGKMFPMAIDMRAYTHSMATSPLVKGGYGEFVAEVKDLGDKWGADGSSAIHPNHPLIRQMGEKLGVPQHRAVNVEQALFHKGILRVTEECLDDKGNPSIWLDSGSFKGAGKSRAKSLIGSTVVMHFGIIRYDTAPGQAKASAQLLRFVRNNEETRGILLPRLQARLKKVGLIRDTIAASAEVDESVADAVASLTAVRDAAQPEQAGKPLSWKWVRSHNRLLGLVKDGIPRLLEAFIEGCGYSYRSLVAIHDKRLPEGSIVIPGYEVGTELAVTRVPTMTGYGIQVMNVVAPLPDMLVGGELLAGACFVAPFDMGMKYMGDDDGDTLLVSSDPELITLHKNVIRNTRIPSLEPVGTKLEISVFDEKTRGQAIAYLAGDPRGAVGIATLWQDAFAAMGMWRHVLAAGLLNQEFVDSAKRWVDWSDFSLAIDPKNWGYSQKIGRDDVMTYVGPKLSANGRRLNKDEAAKAFDEWASKEIARAGLVGKGLFPAIPWRQKKQPSLLLTVFPFPLVRGKKPGTTGNLINLLHAEVQAWLDKTLAASSKNGGAAALAAMLQDKPLPHPLLVSTLERVVKQVAPEATVLEAEVPFWNLQTEIGLKGFSRTVEACSKIKSKSNASKKLQRAKEELMGSLVRASVTDIGTFVLTAVKQAEVPWAQVWEALAYGPLSDALVTSRKVCRYMAADSDKKFAAFKGRVESLVTEGESIHDAFVVTAKAQAHHEKTTGVPLTQCKCCLEKFSRRSLSLKFEIEKAEGLGHAMHLMRAMKAAAGDKT